MENAAFAPHDVFKQALALSPPYKLSSAKVLVCFNIQIASMLLKIGENVV